MYKRTVITSLTAAALAGLFLTGNVSENVKADVKPDGETTKAKSAKENAQDNVDSAQKEVNNAQQNVNSAKADLDSAQNKAQNSDLAYSAQKDKTDAAQKVEADRKSALDQATEAQKQAEALVADSENPAKVKQVNDDVNVKSGALDAAQKEQTAADENVSDQEAQVKQNQDQVNNLTKIRDDKQNAKNAADQKVKDAQDALSGTGITEAKANLDKANKLVEDTQKNLKEIEQSISDITNTKNAAQATLTQAAKAHNQAIIEQQKAQQAFNEVQIKASKINNQVLSKQNEITTISNKLSRLNQATKNIINIGNPDKYKQAYADYINSADIEENRVLPDNDAKYLSSIAAQNKYVNSKKDAQQIVDVKNISDDQIKELSLFVTDLINKVRVQLGEKSTDEVTIGAIDLTKQIIKKGQEDYQSGKWDGTWHDALGINEISKENNLNYNANPKTNKKWQPYEDKASFYLDSSTNMNDLKANIYSELNSMILGGRGYNNPDQIKTNPNGVHELAHASGLLNVQAFSLSEINQLQNSIKNDKETIEMCQETLAQDPTATGTHNSKVVPLSEILQSTQTQLTTNQLKLTKIENAIKDGKVYTTKDGNQYVVSVGKNQYVAVIPALEEKNNNYIDAHIINISPDQIYDNSKFDATVVLAYAAQIKVLEDNLNSQESELNKLNALANQLNKNKNEAKSKLKVTQSNVTTVQKNIDTANQVINKATEQLNKADKNKDIQITQLGKAQKTMEIAKKHYDDLTASHDQKVKEYNSAIADQKNAESALVEAQNNLVEATNSLNTAKNKLASLQKDAQSKAAVVKQAQAELDAANNRVQELKNAPQVLIQATQAKNEEQANYNVAKNNADAAQTQLKKLETEKAATDAQVATAQANYNKALANLNAAQDKLANAKSSLERIEEAEESFTTPIVQSDTNLDASTTQSDKNTNTNTLSNQTPSTPIESSSELKSIRLTHNAYAYTKNLKIAKNKSHKRILLKKNHYLKAWNNGKIVIIKGKKFYQIGKNSFIKVANTIARKAKKSYISATVKGRKNHKVRVYLENGKFAKKYVYGQKTYKFAENKIIKGKTYYRIYGKKLWVRASDLNLQK